MSLDSMMQPKQAADRLARQGSLLGSNHWLFSGCCSRGSCYLLVSGCCLQPCSKDFSAACCLQACSNETQSKIQLPSAGTVQDLPQGVLLAAATISLSTGICCGIAEHPVIHVRWQIFRLGMLSQAYHQSQANFECSAADHSYQPPLFCLWFPASMRLAYMSIGPPFIFSSSLLTAPVLPFDGILHGSKGPSFSSVIDCVNGYSVGHCQAFKSIDVANVHLSEVQI